MRVALGEPIGTVLQLTEQEDGDIYALLDNGNTINITHIFDVDTEEN